ncbi:glycosyltransferase family 4 protein [Pseudoalteromonas byunsanensis]|uniref:Glycosyltransferase WbuB n=1 Tax=Pseudoalteromonas byunsanensis TaxID=327939 RepID=A0A1S1N248_9GAMM|nr:glycosyltransferase family 4 protein [Pseudoalteromonas byunsanensis]OHU95266.1 glycosyltransferase WbuB [Pseudoalteromonas byunsanensis]
MKILILSFYFKPDLCAGSFRATALVEELKQRENIEVDVITTIPNRYASFNAGAETEEVDGNVRLRRVELPSHKSGMLDQVKSFFTFYKRANQAVKDEQYDLVFATSSRLFTAFLGARIAKKKKLPLYLDVRDIFVDTIKDVLNPKLAFIMKPILGAIESYTFSNADHINLVSKGFEEYFYSRYKSPKYTFFTNGIDKEFLDFESQSVSSESDDRVKTVLYAGNIGEGQGLNTIIPELAKAGKQQYHFKIIGDGGRKDLLLSNCKGIENISFHPPVNREQLLEEYSKADVLFLHLNDYPAFKKVLPSKVFEYAATGKPILAGVSGYAAEFIRGEVSNAAVFYPGDDKAAYSALNSLNSEYTDRKEFNTKYTRSNIMKEMSASILSCRNEK